MNPEAYDNLRQTEADHFYFQSLHRLIISLIRTRIRPDGNLVRLLEAGCGTGLLASKMTALGKVSAVDLTAEAVRLARGRGLDVAQASVTALPFANSAFDFVVSVDVLCQLKEAGDEAALAEFDRVLKPGGYLFLRLPAFSWLRRGHDEFVQSQRRYQRRPLQNLVEAAGFKIEIISYFGLSIFGPAVIRRLLDSWFKDKTAGSDLQRWPRPLNWLLTQILIWEGGWLQRFRLPLGVGVICWAKKG